MTSMEFLIASSLYFRPSRPSPQSSAWAHSAHGRRRPLLSEIRWRRIQKKIDPRDSNTTAESLLRKINMFAFAEKKQISLCLCPENKDRRNLLNDQNLIQQWTEKERRGGAGHYWPPGAGKSGPSPTVSPLSSHPRPAMARNSPSLGHFNWGSRRSGPLWADWSHCSRGFWQT